jgi:hypothetical protein
MTSAQRAAMHHILNSEVWVWKAGLAWHKPRSVRAGVLNRLLADGLIELAQPHECREVEWIEVRLTAFGQAEFGELVAA